MLAKRFAYVCAGLFLLVLTYHLGAREAGSQIAGTPVASIVSSSAAAVDGSGVLYITTVSGSASAPSADPPAIVALPRAGSVIACTGYRGGGGGQIESALVVYSDGEIYRYWYSQGWSLHGRLFQGGPTPATSTTWGKVKADYRK